MTDSELRALTPEQLIEDIIQTATAAKELWKSPTTFVGFSSPHQRHLCTIGNFVISARFPEDARDPGLEHIKRELDRTIDLLEKCGTFYYAPESQYSHLAAQCLSLKALRKGMK